MSKELNMRAEEFLFGHGLTIDDYFIERSPVSEMVCYRNAEGREFDLQINDPELASSAIRLLKELGVRVVTLG